MKFYPYALTLCNNILERVTTEIKVVSPASQKQLNETNIHNHLAKTKKQNVADCDPVSTAELNTVEPIVRLWILRLLIPLGCHRKFIGKHDFNNDEIARLFALQTNSNEADDCDEIELALICALDMEGSDDQSVIKHDIKNMRNLDDSDQPENHYDAKKALHHLKRCHKAAEQNAAKISLPQPLAGNLQLLAKQVGLTEVECAILAFTVLIHTERLLNEASGWLGRELSPLDVYHVLSVLLGYPEAEIRAALSMSSTLSQTALVVLDRSRHDDLKDMLDLLSSSFANKIISESGSPIDWLRDMVLETRKAD